MCNLLVHSHVRTFELPFCMFVMVDEEHDVEEGLLRPNEC